MAKIAKARGRSVEEWIGATPDSVPPDHVRLRIFERYNGRCYVTGVKLQPGDWHLDHIVRLEDGGENRESNLAPIYAPKHREKTGREEWIGATPDPQCECRRNAPISMRERGVPSPIWPLLSIHDWCGEHQPREAAQ